MALDIKSINCDITIFLKEGFDKRSVFVFTFVVNIKANQILPDSKKSFAIQYLLFFQK